MLSHLKVSIVIKWRQKISKDCWAGGWVSPSWLPNQMISLWYLDLSIIYISIPRWPRNIAHQCTNDVCEQKKCLSSIHMEVIWNVCVWEIFGTPSPQHPRGSHNMWVVLLSAFFCVIYYPIIHSCTYCPFICSLVVFRHSLISNLTTLCIYPFCQL